MICCPNDLPHLSISLHNNPKMFSVLSCTLFLLLHTYYSQAQECAYNSCKCDTSRGTIDLTSLVNADDYSISGTDGSYMYYYNPCQGLNYGSCPYGSAICQENAEKTSYFSTGSIGTEIIIVENEVSIQYTGGDDERHSIVKLVCDQAASTPSFTIVGEPYPLEYDFQLVSKCACFDGCSDDTPVTPPSDKPSNKNSGSKTTPTGEVGIVLMVIAIAALVTYFIVGGIILHTKFERRGSEVIPQKNFWFLLPLLVKDGFMFSLTPIIRLIKRDPSYEAIK